MSFRFCVLALCVFPGFVNAAEEGAAPSASPPSVAADGPAVDDGPPSGGVESARMRPRTEGEGPPPKSAVIAAEAHPVSPQGWHFTGAMGAGLSTSMGAALHSRLTAAYVFPGIELEVWGQAAWPSEGYRYDLGFGTTYVGPPGRATLGMRVRWEEYTCVDDCGSSTILRMTQSTTLIGLDGSLSDRWRMGPVFLGIEWVGLFVGVPAAEGRAVKILRSSTYANGEYQSDQRGQHGRLPEIRALNVEMGFNF